MTNSAIHATSSLPFVISVLHILNDFSLSVSRFHFFKVALFPPSGPVIDSPPFSSLWAACRRWIRPHWPCLGCITFWFSALRVHCFTPASCWFLAWFTFYPENEGSALLRNACGVLHDVTFQKMVHFIVPAVRVSDATKECNPFV
jgi:hypothetical protein